MTRSQLLLFASGLDLIAGDPEWFPHPVRLMGWVVAQGEGLLRRPGRSSRVDFYLGALLTTATVLASYLAAKSVLAFMRKRSRLLGDAGEISLAWTCIAARNLSDEASSVLDALDVKDLVTARRRVSRIVGRDTESLDEGEISRAVIETVAESLSDGVIAPLFYLAIGGVPLAFAYKAINTLDSMIGHADERYFFFGKFAARLDDAANLLPARLTALVILGTAFILPGCNVEKTWCTWYADHARHQSPNAGHPESAMAGALGVRLGGENRYAGERVPSPYLGPNFPTPSPQKARKSIKVLVLTTILSVALFGILQSLAANKAQR